AQVLLLRLGDAQLVPGPPDVFRKVIPRLGLLLGGPDEVVDVVEVDVREVGAPPRHRTLHEVPVRLQPGLPHPLGLALEPGDLLDDLLVQPPLRREHVVCGVVPPEAVALAQLSEVLFLGDGHVLVLSGWGPVDRRSRVRPPGTRTTLRWPVYTSHRRKSI